MVYQKYESKKNNYYGKSKQIKKKDAIADDPEQISRWIQARRKNYPGPTKRLLRQAIQQAND